MAAAAQAEDERAALDKLWRQRLGRACPRSGSTRHTTLSLMEKAGMLLSQCGVVVVSFGGRHDRSREAIDEP
jgi:hypothetical protein